MYISISFNRVFAFIFNRTDGRSLRRRRLSLGIAGPPGRRRPRSSTSSGDAVQRQHSERRQPVASTVIARDMGQARAQMGLGRLQGDRATRIINFEKIAQGFPTPRTRKVETIEMSEFWIGPVADL